MPEDTYPTPLHSSSYDTGPIYLKYLQQAKDYAPATIISVYEDQGRDFNYSATDVPQLWEITYNGLTDEDAKILDDFWNAHKLHVPFTFIEPRDHPWTYQEGNTFTGCHFVSFERDHDQVKGIQKRKVVIAKYPS